MELVESVFWFSQSSLFLGMFSDFGRACPAGFLWAPPLPNLSCEEMLATSGVAGTRFRKTPTTPGPPHPPFLESSSPTWHEVPRAWIEIAASFSHLVRERASLITLQFSVFRRPFPFLIYVQRVWSYMSNGQLTGPNNRTTLPNNFHQPPQPALITQAKPPTHNNKSSFDSKGWRDFLFVFS